MLAVKSTFIAVVVSLALVMAALGQQPAKRKAYSVSVPRLTTTTGERVVSFDIRITAGEVQALSNVPIGWYVVVDNDPSWRTKVSGNTTVGAASLSADEFQKIRLVVNSDETYLKFAVTGTVSVTKDFAKERPITLKTADFLVTAAE